MEIAKSEHHSLKIYRRRQKRDDRQKTEANSVLHSSQFTLRQDPFDENSTKPPSNSLTASEFPSNEVQFTKPK
jgi:hypothetical protein